jgi:hypothetical protein
VRLYYRGSSQLPAPGPATRKEVRLVEMHGSAGRAG